MSLLILSSDQVHFTEKMLLERIIKNNKVNDILDQTEEDRNGNKKNTAPFIFNNPRFIILSLRAPDIQIFFTSSYFRCCFVIMSVFIYCRFYNIHEVNAKLTY